ncbi:MAG: hypothetical protein QM804_13510 [Propionicimonas sp.]
MAPTAYSCWPCLSQFQEDIGDTNAGRPTKDRRGKAKHLGVSESTEQWVGIVDRRGVGEHEDAALEHEVHRQRGDERRNSGLGCQKAVHRTDQNRHQGRASDGGGQRKGRHEARRRGGRVPDHHRDQDGDRPDRQIEAFSDDRDRLRDGEQANN